MDGTFEAIPAMDELMDRVTRGETLTIVKDGEPVATLTPVPRRRKPSEAEIAAAVADMRAFRERQTLGGVSWRELRDEGRR